MNAVLKFALENWEFVAAAVYAVLEFWLGKTEAVKSGSVLELVMKIFTLWKSKSPK